MVKLIITHYYQSKFQSLVNRLSSNRKIELDKDEIRVISKDKKVESFRLSEIDKVIVKDDPLRGQAIDGRCIDLARPITCEEMPVEAIQCNEDCLHKDS